MREMAANIEKPQYIIHPHKFILWLFIVTIILFFGGLTSAYIVSRGIELDNGNWLLFRLPNLLYYTSGIILVSSITMQWSVWMAKKGDLMRAKLGLVLTLVLGLFFLFGQLGAWSQLNEAGIFFSGYSSSGSYMFLLTGVHGGHLLAGLIYLLIVTIKSRPDNSNSDAVLAYENCATFWHFLGLLWIYLFIFLLINHAS